MVNKLLKRVSLKKKKIKIQFISNILFNYMYLIMLELYKFAIAQFPSLSYFNKRQEFFDYFYLLKSSV